jgi:ubiquinone/menaquinone biosynthesis C-methylase UbiE
MPETHRSGSSPEIPSLIRKVYRFFLPAAREYVKKELAGCETALDLGCGPNSLLEGMALRYTVGVDIFEPYLEECRRKKIHSNYIRADIREIDFKDGSFDAVLMLEVLEHCTKEEGQRLLYRCYRWARKKVIITTPNGYLPQDEYDNNPFQEHISGWSVEELQSLGFRVTGLLGWKRLQLDHWEGLRRRPTLLKQVISDVTQKLTHHSPTLAYRLLAVKTVDKDHLR